MNIGGWNNTQGAVQKGAGGGKEIVIAKPHSVGAGHTYDVRIQVRGTKVTLFLDGQVGGSFDDNQVAEPFAQVVTPHDRTGEPIQPGDQPGPRPRQHLHPGVSGQLGHVPASAHPIGDRHDRHDQSPHPAARILTGAAETVIWRRSATGRLGGHLWAPELHRIDGRWYVYFAAGPTRGRWPPSPPG